LKPEQIEGSESCVAARDVVAILPTGFGKSLIYQVFCLVKLSTLNPNVGVLVIFPFNGIMSWKNKSVN